MKRNNSWAALAIVAVIFSVYSFVAKRSASKETRLAAPKPSTAATPVERAEVLPETAPQAWHAQSAERPPKLSASDEAAVRLAQSTKGVDRTYGKAMLGLGLTSEEIGI